MTPLQAATTDIYGFGHARGNEGAWAAFARATRGLLAYRPDMLAAIDDTAAAEPDFPAAHVLKGLALLRAARPETIQAAAVGLPLAQALLGLLDSAGLNSLPLCRIAAAMVTRLLALRRQMKCDDAFTAIMA